MPVQKSIIPKSTLPKSVLPKSVLPTALTKSEILRLGEVIKPVRDILTLNLEVVNVSTQVFTPASSVKLLVDREPFAIVGFRKVR